MKRSCPEITPRIVWLLMGALAVGVSGCRPTATMTGKISHQGRPVVHGSVVVLCADKTVRSGVIAPDGSYSVPKVPAGQVKLGVISRNPSKGRSVLRGHEAGSSGKSQAIPQRTANPQWFPLPVKFESPETSGLGCTLASGRVNHDIELR